MVVSVQKERPPPRKERLADCSGFQSSKLASQIESKLTLKKGLTLDSSQQPERIYDEVFDT